MALMPHTKANRRFAAGCAPSKRQWLDWLRRGVIRGKEVDGNPYIDISWFDANDTLSEQQTSGSVDLLA